MADELILADSVTPRQPQQLSQLHRELAGELASAGWSNAKIARVFALSPALAALLPPLTAIAADVARAAAAQLG